MPDFRPEASPGDDPDEAPEYDDNWDVDDE
jgi:hypothetical protein